jgi:hypothetical protein
MNIFDVIDNQVMIQKIFGAHTPVKDQLVVRQMKIEMYTYNLLHLIIDVYDLPATIPKKWRLKGYNCIGLHFDIQLAQIKVRQVNHRDDAMFNLQTPVGLFTFRTENLRVDAVSNEKYPYPSRVDGANGHYFD